MKSILVVFATSSLINADVFVDVAWDPKVTQGVGAWSNPCSQTPLKGTTTCDTTKSFEDRANDLVYTQEKNLNDYLTVYQGLTGNGASGVSELNIPAYQWWSEALHGVANSPGVNYNGPIKATTMFPQVITTAASFNSTLWNLLATVISTEGRAMFNNAQAGLTFWAPNINIFRDPRWGRGQETPGEDPFVNAAYATEFVSGMQDGDDKYLKVSSCCKHYADYSMEDSDGETRHDYNAIVSQYDQNDTYLVAFKYCAVGGHASSVMCSYNAENGIPSCANKELLTTYLRDMWGFEGYITSDCGAVSNVYSAHHYTNTTGTTIDAVFSAGMDLDCGSFTQKYTASAVQNNDASLSELQAAMYRAAMVQFRLGLFDDPSSIPWSNLGASDVCTNASLDLARDASRQGIVLFKNINNALPLDMSKISSIANIGPNANNPNVLKGNYYGDPPFTITVQAGLQMYCSNVQYQQGCAMDSTNVTGIASAVSIAQTSDVTVLVVGLDETQESEGHDRTSLLLPGEQNHLIDLVSSSAKGMVILVVLSGGCVDISQWRDSNNIDAIIWGGYPGMYGGEAIADVIFGTFNPTGRLTQTFYYESYTQEIEMIDMNMRPNITLAEPGRGYRYYPGDVVYPFGSGMSYSTFSCGSVTEANGKLTTSITNTGTVNGGAVVLVYFVPNMAGQDGVELKRLIAFGRANMLQSGGKQMLTMEIYPEFLNGEEHQNMNGKYVTGGACMA